jgi:hypothetical protein
MCVLTYLFDFTVIIHNNRNDELKLRLSKTYSYRFRLSAHWIRIHTKVSCPNMHECVQTIPTQVAG